MEHHSTDQLHVVVPHAQESPSPFAADGKGLDQNVVEGFTGRQPPFERLGLAAEFGLAHRLVPWLQQIDGLDFGIELADVAGIGGAEEPGDEPFGPAAKG